MTAFVLQRHILHKDQNLYRIQFVKKDEELEDEHRI